MAMSWADGVNTRAYGMETDSGDNVARVGFESGKERTYLKNSKGKKTHSFIIRMNDVGSDSEFKRFVNWYDNVVMSGSVSFMFPDLITNIGFREYRMAKPFGASGQKYKEVKLTVEEM